MIIYCIRHAESEVSANLSDRERDDAGLSKLGYLQTKAIVGRLRSFGVMAVFSSSILRAKETAQIITESLDVSLTFKENLREFSVDLDERNPEKQKALKLEARQYPDKVMKGGESLNQAVWRLRKVIEEVSNLSYPSVAIVVHRVVAEKLLADLFDMRRGEGEWLKCASVTALEVEKGEIKKCLFANRRFRNWELNLEVAKRQLRFLFRKLLAS